jgi:hypothetical protein
MSTFGNIKTKIENASVELAKKPEFKKFMYGFQKLVLENKDLSELYFIYDDLSKNKGLPTDIVDDYINESVEYTQFLIEEQKEELEFLVEWVDSWTKTNDNNYKEIDNIIYNNSIKNLESILESKKKIKNTLITENKTEVVKENINLPLSSMVKVANTNLKKKFDGLNESDKKELNDILSLNGEQLKEEFEKTKKIVLDNLKVSINESTDKELKGAIDKTMNKVMEAKCNHYDYYKLKKLSLGL